MNETHNEVAVSILQYRNGKRAVSRLMKAGVRIVGVRFFGDNRLGNVKAMAVVVTADDRSMIVEVA